MPFRYCARYEREFAAVLFFLYILTFTGVAKGGTRGHAPPPPPPPVDRRVKKKKKEKAYLELVYAST